MTLAAGTVAISDAEVVSGTGLARAVYDTMILMDNVVSFLPKMTLTQRLAVKRGQAAFANALGAAIIPYLTANAVTTAVVTVNDTGVQRMPASTAEDTDCKAPASPVTLYGGLT